MPLEGSLAAIGLKAKSNAINSFIKHPRAIEVPLLVELQLAHPRPVVAGLAFDGANLLRGELLPGFEMVGFVFTGVKLLE